MIWPTDIHRRRTFDEWIGHPDCGFPVMLLTLLESSKGRRAPSGLPPPVEYVARRPIASVPDVESFDKLIGIFQHFAPYTDSAFWASGRGLRDVTRRFTVSQWLGLSFRDSYIDCDILVIDDIPRNDSSDPHHLDCLEINNILRERQTKKGKLTIVIGNATESLPAMKQYGALLRLQEGYQ